jgi:hypothetical protein
VPGCADEHMQPVTSIRKVTTVPASAGPNQICQMQGRAGGRGGAGDVADAEG